MNRTLIQAAGKCDLPLLDQTLEGEYGTVEQEDLNDALLRAASLGYAECVSRLLAHGADPDAQDPYDMTPLMYAAESNHIRVVRLLLSAGCDVNEVSDTGRTALHLAVKETNPPVVLLLLRSGCSCDPDCQDDNGDTPVMYACRAGIPLILQMLLHGQADVNLRNGEKMTAAHYAAQNGDRLCALLLIEAKAELDAVNHWGYTPLLLACKAGNGPVAELLVEGGADVHLSDRQSRSPLHFAIKNGLVGATRGLLKAGALDMMDSGSMTPLMEAVYLGHLELTRMLVGANFNVNVCSQLVAAGGGGQGEGEGEPQRVWCTPLEAALRGGHLAIADLLVMAGSSLRTISLWTGGEHGPKEVLENERTMAWVRTALEKPLPLMALSRLAVRQSLGFWPQEKLKKLQIPKGLLMFLNYLKT